MNQLLMKRLYTLFVAALVAIVGAVSATAESVTLKIADPSAVKVAVGSYYSSQLMDIVAGDNVIPFDPSTYSTLYITALDGYKLVSVTGASSDYGDLYVNYGYSAELYLGSSVDGRVYTVNTLNLDEVRNATVTIKVVDDYTVVRATRTGGTSINLTGPETEVRFIAGEESPILLQRTDYQELYSVKVNGEKIAASNGQHFADVNDGDVIEIQANYPDIDVPVTVNIPDDAKSAITSFQVNYSEIAAEVYLGADFTVKAGSNINMYFDSYNYNIASVKVNGEVQPTYFNYKVGTEPVTIDIDAHPYGDINFTINVSDPSQVVVYPGESTYGAEPFTLVAGENPLSVGERTGKIYIKAASGYVIKSLTDGNGNPLILTYNVLSVSEGMVINIETEEIVYDGKFVIYLDSTEGVEPAYWSDEETREYNNLSAGYTVVPFSTAAQLLYMIAVRGEYPYIVYRNGAIIENTYESQYYSSQFVPENGDVYKIFTQGVAPETRNITFELSGENLDGIDVTTDILTHHSDFAAGLSVLDGTLVNINVPDGAEITVKVDDDEIETDENGAYSITVTADHKVSITSSTGIADVTVGATADGPVYNLQGMKVLDKSCPEAIRLLPAGIYIANGKKFVVR